METMGTSGNAPFSPLWVYDTYCTSMCTVNGCIYYIYGIILYMVYKMLSVEDPSGRQQHPLLRCATPATRTIRFRTTRCFHLMTRLILIFFLFYVIVVFVVSSVLLPPPLVSHNGIFVFFLLCLVEKEERSLLWWLFVLFFVSLIWEWGVVNDDEMRHVRPLTSASPSLTNTTHTHNM